MSRDSVSACVACLSSAYHDGATLIQQIKARNAFQGASIEASAGELESSLNRGENAVKNQYESTNKRCGDAFAQGDQLARDALQDIITRLQEQVITNLEAQWQRDTVPGLIPGVTPGVFVDFIALQDVCDSSQDRAILVLMQLQQRTITLGPVETLPLNPFSDVGPLSQNVAQPVEQDPFSPNTSSGNFLHVRKMSLSPSVSPITPPSTPNMSLYCARPDSARVSRERTSTDRRHATQYKPMATTVTTTGLFGIGKRTRVEPVVTPPENPLVDEYWAMATEDANNGLPGNASIRSRANSMSPIVSSIYEPDHPAFNSSPALSQRPTNSILSFDAMRHAPSNRFSDSIRSFDSQRHTSATTVQVLSSNRSINSIDPKDLLPSAMNNYAFFCKGAWRQQIGDIKKAVEERVRPGGMYNAEKYYQCKQCKFEGRLIIENRKSRFDTRVFKLVQGIQFRWEFLFKSHISVKKACSDPTKATFGCIFCCVEGRGTPMFGGIQTFMNHLVEHRNHLPTGEVLYRMNCLVGRQAAVDEDFDLNITSMEGGQI